MKKTLLALCLILFLLLAACDTPQAPADSTGAPTLPEIVSSAQPSREETASVGTEAPASESESPEPTEAPTSESASPEPTEAHADMVISAAGLELKYPQKWADRVSVTQEEDRVSFARGELRLFDLVFNKPDEGVLLGTVYGRQNIVITVVTYPLEGGDPEAREMQEAVNDILDHLLEEYDFVAGEAGEIIEAEVYAIPTPVTTLYYPTRWKDRVTVDILADRVSFSNAGTPLFDLVFSEDEGFLLGYYDGTPISFVEYPAENEDQARMKDDVNVILDYLSMDEAFE